MKRIALIIGLLFALLVGVLLIRTWTSPSQQLVTEPAAVILLDDKAVVDRLGAAVRLPTISHYDNSQTDFTQLKKLFALIDSAFPRVRAALKREVIGGYSLLYEWKGTDATLKPLLLMGHMDVVPISPGTEREWEQPPFSGVVVNEFLWGRGTLDDKSGVFGILEGAEWLLAQGYQPKRTVLFAFGHDEEVGGEGGARVIAANLKARGVIAEMILDEGGTLAEGLMPGISPPVAFIGTAEKGYVTVEMTASADGGHSSMPPARTAIGTLARAVTRLEDNQMTAALKGPIRDMLTTLGPQMGFAQRLIMANLWLFEPFVVWNLKGSPTTNAAIRTTTAPTIFQSGDKDNVLPIKARAAVNFRVLPGDNEESLLAHVRKVIDDKTITLEARAYGDPSPISSTEGESYRLLARVVKRVFPEVLVSPYLTLGGTDTKHFWDISPNIYRFLPIRLGKPDMNRMHGTNERIAVKDYLGMVRFYTDLLREGGSR